MPTNSLGILDCVWTGDPSRRLLYFRRAFYEDSLSFFISSCAANVLVSAAMIAVTSRVIPRSVGAEPSQSQAFLPINESRSIQFAQSCYKTEWRDDLKQKCRALIGFRCRNQPQPPRFLNAGFSAAKLWSPPQLQ
jgi:hypothetical protein